MTTTFIYSLAHPLTDEIRYVGKANDIKDRFRSHLHAKDYSHKSSWVKSLKNDGLIPKIEILDEVPMSEWEFWEKQ